jgi:hypothetical protein
MTRAIDIFIMGVNMTTILTSLGIIALLSGAGICFLIVMFGKDYEDEDY